MKRSTLFLSMALATAAAFGQATPTHPLDIDGLDFPDGTFSTWFPAWEVGAPPQNISKIDDEFYKSRTRPLERISSENDTYDANPTAPYARKFCGFYGATDPTDTWKTLPRYCFEGDNYSMWSYTDMFSNWTSPFFRCTAGLSDVAAKNGTTVGCCWTIGYGASVRFSSSYLANNESRKFATLVKKDGNGKFMYAEKLVRLLKYYGINAVGFNSEFNSDAASMTLMEDFFAECHKIADELGWKFEVHWYAGTTDSGGIRFDTGLAYSEKVFGTADHKVSDMFFLNYNWSQSQLSGMKAAAAALNRSSYDVFAGFDIQGRGVRRNSGATAGWNWIKASEVSIGFWGAHKQNLIHESSTDYGSGDLGMQRAYLKKQELISNGGYNNPAVRPAINENVSGLGIAALGKFHGLAEMMTAKSTIQQLPFVTRFSLGNGQKFYNRGEVTFDSKWYNLGTQDFLPTWRWWITDASDNANKDNLSGFVSAELGWDDAWFGGSCLTLSGATKFSRIKLFKTLLDAKPNEELSIVYKPVGSKDSHLKLFVALKGAVTTYKEIAVPAGKADEWNTFTAKLSDLGVESGKIALMGLVVENTTAEYKTLVGELALRDPETTFNAVKPAIKEVEVLRGRFNAVDFKMRYAAKEETGEEKTYNDEVGTWYYEVFMQQKGEEPVLLTATPSWAAYVIGAPIKDADKNRTARFGVRAVSPNGDMYNENASEISWSDYMDIPYNEVLSDLELNKAVVKPNEEFTLAMVDQLAPKPEKWEILSSATGDVVYTSGSASSITTKLPDLGLYDVRLTTGGKEIMKRSQLQITQEATGAVPEVTAISADPAKTATGEEVELVYAGRKGEGKVSRALTIADPNMLQIDGNVQTGKVYSYALWFKASSFNHLSNGTNLIQKNTIADKWPHNNWGDIWVQIRPEGQGLVTTCNGSAENGKSGANEISYNVMGYSAHQQPWKDMISTGYSVIPGQWTHVVITQDANNRQQMYFNGRLVATANCTNSTRRENVSDTRIDHSIVAPINIGGPGVYKAGFNGDIDELQIWNKALTQEEVLRCMQGYSEGEVPEGLQGYYTFETMNEDGSFPNMGKGSSAYTAQLVCTEDSGGETTDGAQYVKRDAYNGNLGNAGISGTLDIVTEAKWDVQDADVQSTEGSVATVIYTSTGKKDATVTLTNMWGSSTFTAPQLVDVESYGAIGDTFADGELEVSAYNDAVSLRFAEGGVYTINLVSLNGQTVQSNTLNGEAGGTATVVLNAQGGAYLVQVLLNGKQVKVVKLVK